MRNNFLGVELPKPVTDEWDWQLYARCRNQAVTVFFPSRTLRGAKRLQFEKTAKDICRTCPVLLQCRTFALETHQPYGIWGGMTASERSCRPKSDEGDREETRKEPTRHTIGPLKRPFVKFTTRERDTPTG